MAENEMVVSNDEITAPEAQYENVFRRGIEEKPKEKLLAKHRLWLANIQHEYPMPYIPYRIGVYIRFFNQTQYSDEVYLSKHKQWFLDDIALCPRWSLVDFYIDYGSRAPYMESSKEWCRFTVAHELGHIFLEHFEKAGTIVLTCTSVPQEDYMEYEKEANVFARNLLSPAPLALDIIDDDDEEYEKSADLQSAFSITETASYIRLKYLHRDLRDYSDRMKAYVETIRYSPLK